MWPGPGGRPAQAIAGEALRLWGRLAEARDQLTVAAGVLRADPDADTVRALQQLAAAEVCAGSPDADRLTLEVLALGQALDVGTGQLVDLFTDRGVYLGSAGRCPEAVSYYRESARLASQAGDNSRLGRALLSLADVLGATDPAASAEAARAAAGHLRRVGARKFLAMAVTNLAQALLMLGDWDAAEHEFTQAADADGLADYEFFACDRAWLAALRGDASTAKTMLTGLPDLRASEDPQDKSLISSTEAFTAAARNQPQDALRHARGALAYVDALGIRHECLRWAWPLAARAAYELRDAAVVRELLSLLDSYPIGHVAPMLRAERDLLRARLPARDGDPTAAVSLAGAVRGLRELSTPYHLAHGLLDHAQYLILHDPEAGETAVSEARDIAARLRCQPLLDRAAGLTSARPPVQA